MLSLSSLWRGRVGKQKYNCLSHTQLDSQNVIACMCACMCMSACVMCMHVHNILCACYHMSRHITLCTLTLHAASVYDITYIKTPKQDDPQQLLARCRPAQPSARARRKHTNSTRRGLGLHKCGCSDCMVVVLHMR